MSRPPKRASASPTAARAACGSVRSPGAGAAPMRATANSRTRSSRISAERSASTSRAPAAPRPAATAWPIWPTRPTPVTRATRPASSPATAARLHRGDHLFRRRRATLGEPHRAVPPHDVDGTGDPRAVQLDRVIRAGDGPVGIGQQREVEFHLLHILPVTVEIGGIHAEGLDPGSLELGHLIAHGGELAVSPRGVVSRIEHQHHVRAAEQISQTVFLPVGCLRFEVRSLAADRQYVAHGVPLLIQRISLSDIPTPPATPPGPACRPAERGRDRRSAPRASPTRRRSPAPTGARAW